MVKKTKSSASKKSKSNPKEVVYFDSKGDAESVAGVAKGLGFNAKIKKHKNLWRLTISGKQHYPVKIHPEMEGDILFHKTELTGYAELYNANSNCVRKNPVTPAELQGIVTGFAKGVLAPMFAVALAGSVAGGVITGWLQRRRETTVDAKGRELPDLPPPKRWIDQMDSSLKDAKVSKSQRKKKILGAWNAKSFNDKVAIYDKEFGVSAISDVTPKNNPVKMSSYEKEWYNEGQHWGKLHGKSWLNEFTIGGGKWERKTVYEMMYEYQEKKKYPKDMHEAMFIHGLWDYMDTLAGKGKKNPSRDVTFSRILLKGVMEKVKEHTTPKQRKSVWTYQHSKGVYEVQSTGDDKVTPDFWNGRAGNAYEARANFWMKWLEKNGIGIDEFTEGKDPMFMTEKELDIYEQIQEGTYKYPYENPNGEYDDYEIYGYKTQKDYEDRNFEVIDDGLEKMDAIHKAHNLYTKGDYKLLKVQSLDREDIEIIGSTTNPTGKEHAIEHLEKFEGTEATVKSMRENPNPIYIVPKSDVWHTILGAVAGGVAGVMASESVRKNPSVRKNEIPIRDEMSWHELEVGNRVVYLDEKWAYRAGTIVKIYPTNVTIQDAVKRKRRVPFENLIAKYWRRGYYPIKENKKHLLQYIAGSSRDNPQSPEVKDALDTVMYSNVFPHSFTQQWIIFSEIISGTDEEQKNKVKLLKKDLKNSGYYVKTKKEHSPFSNKSFTKVVAVKPRGITNPTTKKDYDEAMKYEEKAVVDYSKMIVKSDSGREKEILTHIKDEELEHMEELMQIRKNPKAKTYYVQTPVGHEAMLNKRQIINIAVKLWRKPFAGEAEGYVYQDVDNFWGARHFLQDVHGYKIFDELPMQYSEMGVGEYKMNPKMMLNLETKKLAQQIYELATQLSQNAYEWLDHQGGHSVMDKKQLQNFNKFFKYYRLRCNELVGMTHYVELPKKYKLAIKDMDEYFYTVNVGILNNNLSSTTVKDIKNFRNNLFSTFINELDPTKKNPKPTRAEVRSAIKSALKEVRR